MALKRVFTADNIAEAGLVRSFLAQHDVPSTLRNEHTSAVIGDLPFVNSYPEVWVEDALYTSALALVKESQQPINADISDWVCSECQEHNPGNFELCWQCSANKQAP